MSTSYVRDSLEADVYSLIWDKTLAKRVLLRQIFNVCHHPLTRKHELFSNRELQVYGNEDAMYREGLPEVNRVWLYVIGSFALAVRRGKLSRTEFYNALHDGLILSRSGVHTVH